MAFNKEVPVQLYYQLTNELRNRIASSEVEVGDLFPTDREIMEQYHVSGTTVRRAVKQLVSEGLLERCPGKGTFVRKQPLQEHLGSLTGFFEEATMQGRNPSADILFIGLVELDSSIREHYPQLAQCKWSEAVLCRKVQKMEGRPIAYVESYWDPNCGKALLQQDLSSQGLYEIIEQSGVCRLTRAEQEIFAYLAGSKVSRALDIKRTAPVLVMQRLAYAGDNIVEFSSSAYRADCYRYAVELHKDKPAGKMILAV